MRRETHESAQVKEQIMLDRLCAAVKEFYENPKNVEAYQAWKHKKEAKRYDANHTDLGPDTGES